MNLIGMMISVSIGSLLSMMILDLNSTMIRSNATANATSDILAYVNQLRTNIQYATNSTDSLKGQSFTGLGTVLRDPLTGQVMAGPNFKQSINDAWQVKYLRFDNVVPVPSQSGLYRGTLVVVFDLDSSRVSGGTTKAKTIGDVFCLVSAGLIQTCYGSTDLITMAQSNCVALGGHWDATKPFGSQCALTLTQEDEHHGCN